MVRRDSAVIPITEVYLFMIPLTFYEFKWLWWGCTWDYRNFQENAL